VQLLPGETVLAAGRFDLDASLHFSDGGIVLTTRRVIADRPASATQPLDGPGPWTWTIGPRTRLDVQLRSAVGRVELSEGDRIVARWLFTPAKADAIHALEDAFDARVAGPDGLSQREGVRKPATVADDAGTESDDKPAPAARGLGDDGGGPASWRALFRLITFARPHAGMAILGGLLRFGAADLAAWASGDSAEAGAMQRLRGAGLDGGHDLALLEADVRASAARLEGRVRRVTRAGRELWASVRASPTP
jgi:ATP-binding cassette subfamily B protein